MSQQCGHFPNYSDLSLLQCQSATNVIIVVQLHTNFFFKLAWKTAAPYRETAAKGEKLRNGAGES